MDIIHGKNLELCKFVNSLLFHIKKIQKVKSKKMKMTEE